MSEVIEKPTLLSDIEYQKMSPQEKETYIKEVLKKTLQLNAHGLTVTQLKDALAYDRRIIEKHLAIMKVTNEVYTVTLGSNIIYIPNHKAMRDRSKSRGYQRHQISSIG